ncbi:hypothetical protein H0H92_005788 [Tricholoma furcatifolium]|nr:hypothetical protein H0H92_005788 [Tricholoma furcatifolium]
MKTASSRLLVQSGDGGLYGEMLQNRAFQQVTPNTTSALSAWNTINAASITVLDGPDAPLSSALPNFLRVVIPSDAKGDVGFGNEGYWGIKVDPSWAYDASFYYRFPVATSSSVTFTVALDSSSGTRLASREITVSGSQTEWKQVKTTLQPHTLPESTANNFTITLNGADAAGLTVDFSLLSLFPPTFNGRENGMRVDIAETLYEMKPAFFRFPGGNNLEGQTVDTRWQWNATVGPLIDRPGMYPSS